MRLATWNINSVRLRIGLVERLLKEEKPHILCLQETKTPDEFFPRAALADLGFKHQHILGMKSYNGVAIISRIPFRKTGHLNWQNRQDCRHIYVELENNLEVHCCYVPAGGDIPDPKINEKFAHKLGFLNEQTTWWKNREANKVSKVLLGDLNIAPLEHDVWSHKQMTDVVSHTPIEIEKYLAWQKAHRFYDAVRHFVNPDEKLYSWWSYRAKDWETSNRGRRLDHVWVTPDLVPSLKKSNIRIDARGWEPKPSDHAPVLLDLA